MCEETDVFKTWQEANEALFPVDPGDEMLTLPPPRRACYIAVETIRADKAEIDRLNDKVENGQLVIDALLLSENSLKAALKGEWHDGECERVFRCEPPYNFDPTEKCNCNTRLLAGAELNKEPPHDK